ncbi:MAG: alpha/beta hydrolase fold domain-containing protein [Alphaproteobacteria bacterium]
MAVRAKAEGLPMPLAIVVIAPWVDLTQSGESMTTRAAQDPSMTKARLDLLAGDLSRKRGRARPPGGSPLFADLAGLPQLLIHVGGDEILLSDAERFVEAARAVGVKRPAPWVWMQRWRSGRACSTSGIASTRRWKRRAKASRRSRVAEAALENMKRR